MPHARATSTRTEYLPEFGRTVRIAEFDRPMMSDDIETAQTIAYMDEIAARDANADSVIAAAHEALDAAGLDANACALDKAKAVFWWLKRTIEYVPTPGTSAFVDQTLIAPAAVLAMPEPIGDCPQFSMLARAMFRVLCMDSMFVTIKAEPRAPDQWSHVYNMVEVFPGQYLPFDSSNGPEPGAEYAKPFARRVWPKIAKGRCSERSKERMLRQTYAGRRGPSVRNSSLRRALGDVSCDTDGNCYDDSTGVYSTPQSPLSLSDVQQSATQGDCAYGVDAAGNCLPGQTTLTLNPAAGPPASASTGASTATAIASDITRLLAPLSTALATSAQKPYYITSPTGQQILYNPATGQAAGASLASLSSSGLLPILLIGGLVIGIAALRK